jgi:hypothetical protein
MEMKRGSRSLGSIANPLVRLILRSLLRGLLSASTVLITV